MPTVVGIRFKDSGKTYFFDPLELDIQVGDPVIVETVRGPELAKVAYGRHDVPESELVSELKPVLRRAEQADLDRLMLLQQRHDEVLERCAEKIEQHNLPMKLVKAEYSFDGSRLTFFFTSEKRVDFRMLVRDLARTFKSRIELRQIGPRDEAKLLGGIGPCGRLLCCATFLPDYARVSIKMAKDQDLPLNPSKISGVCGRLLCCLSYEHEQYLEIKATMPSRGAWVQTPEGPGEVISVNVLKETVMVNVATSQVPIECTPEQIRESTAKVGEVARARVDEGIAPVKADSRRKDRGERRLLRDELESNEVLDALAMLEDSDIADSDESHSRRPRDGDGGRRPDGGQSRRQPLKDAPRGGANEQRRGQSTDQRFSRGEENRSERPPQHGGQGGGRPPRDDDRAKNQAPQSANEVGGQRGQRNGNDERQQGPMRRANFDQTRDQSLRSPDVPPPPHQQRDDSGRVRRRHKQRGERGNES